MTRRELTVHGLCALAATPLGRTLAAGERVLVVVQVRGGWDGLSLLAPADDDDYRRARPDLALRPADGLRVRQDLDLWWHPQLPGLRAAFDRGHLAVVHNVGHAHPDLSHFESEAKWHSADPAGTVRTGWLARLLRELPGAAPPLRALTVEDRPSEAFAGADTPAFTRADALALLPDRGDRARWRRVVADAERSRDAPLRAIAQRCMQTLAVGDELAGAAAAHRALAAYPDTPFAARLRTCAQVICAGLGARVLHVNTVGFDTHSAQADRGRPTLGHLADRFRELDQALSAFVDDLAAHGAGRRVLVLVHSEFGRSLRENRVLGTEHGHCAPVLLLGPGVRGGLHGPAPDLARLAQLPGVPGIPFDDLAIDYRRIYATIAEQWFAVRSEPVLGARYEPLPLL
jgi:uncharacterized protein (DUF1501 family)